MTGNGMPRIRPAGQYLGDYATPRPMTHRREAGAVVTALPQATPRLVSGFPQVREPACLRSFPVWWLMRHAPRRERDPRAPRSRRVPAIPERTSTLSSGAMRGLRLTAMTSSPLRAIASSSCRPTKPPAPISSIGSAMSVSFQQVLIGGQIPGCTVFPRTCLTGDRHSCRFSLDTIDVLVLKSFQRRRILMLVLRMPVVPFATISAWAGRQDAMIGIPEAMASSITCGRPSAWLLSVIRPCAR